MPMEIFRTQAIDC